MVVFLSLAPLVGFSVLMRTIVPVMLLGTLALLYHLKLIASYYIFRGGSSVNTDLCCILFLYTGNIASNTGWNIGTALLFCFILYSSW